MLFSLIASLASGEAADAMRRAKVALIAYAVAGTLLVMGAIFLVIAGYIATAQEIGAVTAALYWAGGFVAVAVVVLIIHRIMVSVQKRRVARKRKTEVTAIASAAAMAVLPTLLASSRARTATFIAAPIALVAYGIWRENRPRPGSTNPPLR
jgi:hypothetical protein